MKLPAAYREFFQILGYYVLFFHSGNDYRTDERDELQEAAKSIARENGKDFMNDENIFAFPVLDHSKPFGSLN